MTDKPMTVGELIEKLKGFDSNELIELYGHPPTEIKVVKDIITKRLVLYPFYEDDLDHGKAYKKVTRHSLTFSWFPLKKPQETH